MYTFRRGVHVQLIATNFGATRSAVPTRNYIELLRYFRGVNFINANATPDRKKREKTNCTAGAAAAEEEEEEVYRIRSVEGAETCAEDSFG